MSTPLTLAADLILTVEGNRISIPSGTVVTFLDANSLSQLAEQLAPMSATAIYDNLAGLTHQVVETTGAGGDEAQTAFTQTYNKVGASIQTEVGPIPIATALEVGTGGATKLTVTYDRTIVSDTTDYKTGFSCKVNGSARTISSSVREASKLVITHTLASGVTTGQTVLLSYSQATGDIESEAAGAEAISFTDQVVVNNT